MDRSFGNTYRLCALNDIPAVSHSQTEPLAGAFLGAQRPGEVLGLCVKLLANHCGRKQKGGLMKGRKEKEGS